jgi:ATP-binding cassette subfamily B protein/subfamily B ATP-binding cassette protein MsbA
VSNITIGLWLALLIGLGAYQVSAGRITVGTLVVFSTYMAVLLFSLHQGSQAFASLKGAIASVKRVFGILDEQIDIRDGHHTLSQDKAHAEINLKNVTFGYSSGAPILKQISLRIKTGQRVAIVGPTGSGKSTLVSLIARFYDPSDGAITLGSQDLRELKIQSLRQNISMVLQPPLLFPISIADNIRYGNPSASDQRVIEAARLAMIDGFINSLPDGYDTMIGERGVNLSEGQKQRITIARALLRDVPIVILDEPTSAMDAETEYQVMASVNRLLKNKTSLIIAHRLSTIRSADLIVVLRNGRLVEQGTFDELVAMKGYFADLCRHQFDQSPTSLA